MTYPPQGTPAIEGNYTTWTIYDTFQDNAASDGGLRQEAIINKTETKILLLDANALIAKAYTIATKTLSAALISDLTYFEGSGAFINQKKVSALQSYVLLMGYTSGILNGDKIYITKDGAILQTLTDSDLGIANDSIRNMAISPSGKHIIVSGYITALLAMGWVVLVGS